MENRTIIKGGRIFTGRCFIDNGAVEIQGSRIADVHYNADEYEAHAGDKVVDISGIIATPGFVDIHIHGAMGCDAMDGSYESINTISKAIALHGTTSFLITTMTAPVGDTYNAIRAAAEAIDKGTDGAQALGVHMEGPFINAQYKGAQSAELIMPPSVEAYRAMVGEYESIIKRVTLAPEVEGALEVVSYLKSRVVLISAGHTSAAFDQMMAAHKAGVSHVTHLYNGMNPIHHRQPGAAGTALSQDGWTVEVIADCVHVHPAMLRLAWLCKGADRCALITDAMEATLMGDGVYELGSQKVIVKNGQARLEAGNLAGSTLTLDAAVKNMVEKADIPLGDALAMASLVPAALVGEGDRKGRLEAGYDADIVLLDESDISVKGVMVGGKWQKNF